MVDDGRDPLGVAIRLGRHVTGSINLTRSLRSIGRDRATATLAGPALEAAREIPDPLAHGIRFTR